MKLYKPLLLKIIEVVRQNIYHAMGHWQLHTCIRFVNRTTQEDYIEFEPGPCGCVHDLHFLKIK